MSPWRSIFLALMVAAVAACDRSGGAAPGTQKATSAPASTGPRIVSIVPAATLQLVQMGAVDCLVGISSYDRAVLPENRQDVPVVGDYLNFNYEALLATRPTAIVMQVADDRMAPRLREIAASRHIELVNVKLDTIADMQATARRLAKLAGRSEVVERQLSVLEAQLRALDEKVKDLPRPKVIYVCGKNPIWVVGAHRFLDEMITRAGGVNLGSRVHEDFPQVTVEQLIKLAPEVLLIGAPDEPAANSLDDPRLAMWLSLPVPAARDKRVYLVTEGNSQLNSLEIGQNTLDLARLIHPELRGWDFAGAGDPTGVPHETPATKPAGAP